VGIIWSSQSSDVITTFVEYLIKHVPNTKIEELLKINNLPSYLIENYKKYFIKYPLITKKDYTFK
jgi:hypothetical protein